MVSGADQDAKMLHCPALVTIKLIAGKWKTRILWALRQGPVAFNALQRQLPGVSAKMLTEHLRQLQADGLVTRTSTRLGKVETVTYAYSDYGRTLVPVLDMLGNLGLAHEERS